MTFLPQGFMTSLCMYKISIMTCSWTPCRHYFSISDANWASWHFNSRVTALSVQQSTALIARFMGPTWGPPGADRTQVGPMLAPWTMLSGSLFLKINSKENIKAPHCWPYMRGIHQWLVDSPSQMTNSADSVWILWCHHANLSYHPETTMNIVCIPVTFSPLTL